MRRLDGVKLIRSLIKATLKVSSATTLPEMGKRRVKSITPGVNLPERQLKLATINGVA